MGGISLTQYKYVCKNYDIKFAMLCSQGEAICHRKCGIASKSKIRKQALSFPKQKTWISACFMKILQVYY